MNRKLEKISAALEPMIAAVAAKGSFRGLMLLAEQAHQQGKPERAIELAQDLLDKAGDDQEIATRARDLIAKNVPDFHVPMLRDLARNQAFEDALQRAVTPNSRVLDVGSGTGLLAMFAARAGARQVFSCEANTPLAGVAREIVRDNGYSRQVTILSKHSSDIDVDTDLGGPVDLVVAEIIGGDMVCEHVVPTLRDVASRLANPGARFVPRSGAIRVALAWWDGLSARGMRTECGFNMSAFNRLLRPRITLDCGDERLAIRGEAVTLFEFDFSATMANSDRTEIGLNADGGPANGVIQWLRLDMDEMASLENRPTAGATSAWLCTFFPFENPVEARKGEIIRIAGTHANNRLQIWKVQT
jgi:type III protein arginine methyltransferase